ncbi:hypothetical protein [Streptomyces gossypiisoli]|uniref:hypothetical protein n=1 Tax=Streptomyces gossypiisoli TaxID=2748864 RepID=UPI0015DBB4B9
MTLVGADVGALLQLVPIPQSVHHAPDHDPKPSDLTAVARADFGSYAPFESYSPKIKEAAGSKAELVEVNLDDDADKVKAEVSRLAKLFGTEDAAGTWKTAFDVEYAKLPADSRPRGRGRERRQPGLHPWAAKLAGATTVGTYGPEPVPRRSWPSCGRGSPPASWTTPTCRPARSCPTPGHGRPLTRTPVAAVRPCQRFASRAARANEIMSGNSRA